MDIREYRKAYYKANKAANQARCREYYVAHREKLLSSAKEYYEDNTEKVLAYQTTFREKNRDSINQYRKDYRAAEPEHHRKLERARYLRDRDKRIAYSLKWARDNRGKANAIARAYDQRKIDNLCDCCTEEEFAEIYEFGHILGWHIDHIIPLSKGGPHCVTNLRPLPGTINQQKWAH